MFIIACSAQQREMRLKPIEPPSCSPSKPPHNIWLWVLELTARAEERHSQSDFFNLGNISSFCLNCRFVVLSHFYLFFVERSRHGQKTLLLRPPQTIEYFSLQLWLQTDLISVLFQICFLFSNAQAIVSGYGFGSTLSSSHTPPAPTRQSIP